MTARGIVVGWRLRPPTTDTATFQRRTTIIAACTIGPIAVGGGLLSGHFLDSVVLAVLAIAPALLAESSPADKRRDLARHASAYARELARFGADGIGFGTDGFIPYRAVTDVEKVDDRLVVSIGPEQMSVFAIRLEDWLMVDELIEQGRTAAARVPADAELEEMLRKQPHDDEATWRARVEALREDGGYRAMAIERARLWRVARDVEADPSARAAACTVLGRAVDGQEQQVWTGLYQTTAHPGVRAALDAMGHRS